jgi:hypothetical protein
MDAYIYRADIYCAEHGEQLRRERREYKPVDPSNESSYDSDNYPKGPYPDGGGEADGPQFCGECGCFLENPLTTDGDAYMRELCEPFAYPDDDGDVAPWPLVAERAAKAGRYELAEAINYYFSAGM